VYPKTLNKLIESLRLMPGVGEKTAESMALFIVDNLEKKDALIFAENIKNAVLEIKNCPISHILTDQEISPIILDKSRDNDIIMVLEDSKDVFMMEKMNYYKGSYHVLGGLIDYSRGITEENLNLDSLSKRLTSNVKEMIIATNATIEGEMTANFLKELYKDNHFKITRLAYGIPVGIELRYTDISTLKLAVENRKEF